MNYCVYHERSGVRAGELESMCSHIVLSISGSGQMGSVGMYFEQHRLFIDKWLVVYNRSLSSAMSHRQLLLSVHRSP